MREGICRPKGVLWAKHFELMKPIHFYLKYTHDVAYILFKIFLFFIFSAPQIAPENFQLTAASSKCVKLTYNNVSYPNGPLDGLIYQVTIRSW